MLVDKSSLNANMIVVTRVAVFRAGIHTLHFLQFHMVVVESWRETNFKFRRFVNRITLVEHKLCRNILNQNILTILAEYINTVWIVGRTATDGRGCLMRLIS